MSYESPTPDNNLVLRHLQGLRREMPEMVERQARIIELLDHLAHRIDPVSTQTVELFSQIDRSFAELRSGIGLTGNRILSAQTETVRAVRRLADRVGDVGARV